MGDDTIKKNISRNIGKYREANGMSQKELAKRLGVIPSRISNWETGANCPTIDILFEVCEALNVSINDIYGVYPNSKFVLQYDEINHIKKYRDLDQHGQETVSYILERETERVKQIEQAASIPAATRMINYYYKLASAGTGQIVFDMPPTKRIEIPAIPEYRKADYAIGVNGNSMEPVYHDGDTLLVEMTDSVEICEIGIFLVNGESFVKERGKTELISLNPESKNIPLNEDARCLGRVIGKLESIQK